MAAGIFSIKSRPLSIFLAFFISLSPSGPISFLNSPNALSLLTVSGSFLTTLFSESLNLPLSSINPLFFASSRLPTPSNFEYVFSISPLFSFNKSLTSLATFVILPSAPLTLLYFLLQSLNLPSISRPLSATLPRPYPAAAAPALVATFVAAFLVFLNTSFPLFIARSPLLINIDVINISLNAFVSGIIDKDRTAIVNVP